MLSSFFSSPREAPRRLDPAGILVLYRNACANEIDKLIIRFPDALDHSAAGAVGNLPVLARSIDGVPTADFDGCCGLPVTTQPDVLTDYGGV